MTALSVYADKLASDLALGQGAHRLVTASLLCQHPALLEGPAPPASSAGPRWMLSPSLHSGDIHLHCSLRPMGWEMSKRDFAVSSHLASGSVMTGQGSTGGSSHRSSEGMV